MPPRMLHPPRSIGTAQARDRNIISLARLRCECCLERCHNGGRAHGVGHYFHGATGAPATQKPPRESKFPPMAQQDLDNQEKECASLVSTTSAQQP
eukprot:8670014-Pyramimonas_sp.AAC.1